MQKIWKSHFSCALLPDRQGWAKPMMGTEPEKHTQNGFSGPWGPRDGERGSGLSESPGT